MENDGNIFDAFGALFGLPVMGATESKDHEENPRQNLMSHLQDKIRALEEENQRLRLVTSVILETLIDAEVTSKDHLKALIAAALEKKHTNQQAPSPDLEVPEVSEDPECDEVEICVCCGKNLETKDGQCISCGHFQDSAKK
jgi:hypothetical protein